jgi:hypothetical protein
MKKTKRTPRAHDLIVPPSPYSFEETVRRVLRVTPPKSAKRTTRKPGSIKG